MACVGTAGALCFVCVFGLEEFGETTERIEDSTTGDDDMVQPVPAELLGTPASPETVHAPEHVAPDTRCGRHQPVGPRSVLVVDDEPAFTGAADKVLSRAGYEVLIAESLSAATGLLNSRLFDAVITDLSLNGTMGYEGLEIARLARSRNPDVRVILVTAFGSDEASRQAVECGVDLQLDKPVSLGLLRRVLSDFGLAGVGADDKPRGRPGPAGEPVDADRT